MTLLAPAAGGISAHLDDLCERREPGHKARVAAARAERHQAWQARRAAILARYGSREAVFAPTEPERLILAAVAPWREVWPDNSWTRSLDGWRLGLLDWDKAPPHVLDAIRGAYPMPATFAAAKAEADAWAARNAEMDDIQAIDGPPVGDHALDLPMLLRWHMVRALAEHELPTSTLADLRSRFAMLRASDIDEPEIEAALFRDLTAMVEREADAAAEALAHHGAAPTITGAADG